MLEKTIDNEGKQRAVGNGGSQNSVDIEVGKRIKKRRLQLRLSQGALGAAIGVSFQQVQKYERGINRVSAATLYELAHVLDAPIGFFFDGLGERRQVCNPELTEKALVREEFVATDEGQRLVDAFLLLPSRMRSKFITLVATFTSVSDITRDRL